SVLQLTVHEDTHGVGMLELAHRPRFATKSTDQTTASFVIGVEDLDGHLTAHVRLFGSIDRPHSSSTDLLGDLKFTVKNGAAHVRVFAGRRRHRDPTVSKSPGSRPLH